MTIRSMPPASSHLADRPVPAPPPMSGRPAAILARKRSSSVCSSDAGHGERGERCRRVRAARARDLAPGGDQRVGEGLVVDVQRQADAACGRRRRGSAARSPRTARGRPRGRGTAGPAGRSPRRRPRGSGSAPGRVIALSLSAMNVADRAALVGRRAHQRHGRVVAVELPRLEALGHRVPGAEVHHVERAARADVGQRRGARTRRAASARPRARRRRSRRRSRSSRRRSRRRAGPSRRAFPSTGRRRRWRGRRGSRSRPRGA